MQNKISFILLFVSILTQSILGQNNPEELFAAGNKAYEAEQYDSALICYSKIIELGKHSAEVYQNMGTAAYKLDDVPNSIYYLEKAKKLNPGNPDLEHNLALANQKVVDKQDTKKRTDLSSWLSKSVGHTADYWGQWAVIMAVLGALFLLAYLLVKITLIRKIGIVSGVLSWALMIAFILFAYVQKSQSTSQIHAVIFNPSIEIKNEPSEASSTAFVLHEGSKVDLLDETATWFKISFGNDKVGWIQKSDLKVI